jgi:hypothetical protein
MTLPKQKSVPEQEEGQQVDIVESKTADTTAAAKELYAACKKRLFDINRWADISGTGSATFTIMDKTGNPKQGLPGTGDHFRIDIPGPGSSAGDGYDWVQVELVEDHADEQDDHEWTVMKVRPASNPNSPKEEVAHFLDEKATSSFIVRRNGYTVSTEVHGRNEKPNTTGNIPDKIRNTLVGSAAALGISAIQWKKLASGLLNGS